MEPVSNNPNHDSSNPVHYNVVAWPRNSHSKGLLSLEEQKANLEKLLKENSEDEHLEQVQETHSDPLEENDDTYLHMNKHDDDNGDNEFDL